MLLHHEDDAKEIMTPVRASARVAEARLEDLPGGAPRQGGDDRDLPGVLEGGEPLPAVEDERVRRGPGAGSERDEGLDLLAERGVWHADHRGLGDPRVGQENRLHLLGKDRVAAAQDPLALASDDSHEAVRGERREVPGPEPAVQAEDRARLLRIVQVPLHRGRTLDPQLADLAGGQHAARVVHGPTSTPGTALPIASGDSVVSRARYE